ncbi:MAG: glycosyltransferase family 2 protein [Planctomycetaceae bacterium]|jgi:glycosyltransferase involved in cell wall biosynthesis|nr:glycosyltransferase family 2 protein [Planctomycetaceae bacterium]MCP4814316.1 glycosyltransferase family 2 protein [Planctomycetaceae bacterium]
MDITVAICTWNRADLLNQTLTRLQQLVIPEDLQWEIVVVNNACTDHTPEIVTRHQEHLPLRMVMEPEPGLSCARNRAVQAAQGRWIIWTDDDILVSNQWLAQYWKHIHDLPDASFLGGPITPWYEITAPDWVTAGWKTVCAAYGFRQLGDEIRPFTHRHLPFGANYGMPLDIQRRYPYDPDLGRKQAEMLSGEETVVLRKMLADGHRGYWLPEASIQHFIPADHLTLDYVSSQFHGFGRTAVLMEQRSKTNPSRIPFSRKFRCYCKALMYSAIYGVLKRIAGPRWWVTYLAKTNRRWGRISAYREINQAPADAAPPPQRMAA